MGSKSYAKVRDELVAAQRTFIGTELSIATTIADIAKRHYQEGNSDHGDHKGEAENALKTVRYFSATTDLLTSAEIGVLASRCEELERIVSTLNGG